MTDNTDTQNNGPVNDNNNDNQDIDNGPSLEEELTSLFDGEEPDDSNDDNESNDQDDNNDLDNDDDSVAPDQDSDDDEPEATEADDDDDEDDDDDSPIQAPASWKGDNKKLFEQLPEELQRQVADREAEREKKINSVLEENADIHKALDPYEDRIKQSGMSKGDLMNRLLKAQDYLTSSPLPAMAWLSNSYVKDKAGAEALIKHLSEKHGITTNSNTSDSDDDYTDPKVKQLQDELAKLRGEIDQKTNTNNEASMQAIKTEIADFAKATDDDGKLKHPHFDQVRTKMAGLIQTGAADDYEQAYEQAIWADPSLRDTLLEDQRKRIESEDKKKRQEKVNKAKKSKLPSGKSGKDKNQNQKPKTLEDEISQLMDASAES